MLSDIKVRTFTGKSVKAYLPSLARLRLEVFREYPYLYEGTLDQEMQYLKKFIQSPEAIVVLAFDGTTIVGASPGIPLENEIEPLQTPFINNGLDVSSFYYFGKSVLLKKYRGRGIWHHFFDLREDHVKRLEKFRHICFCEVSRPEDHPKKPPDYLPLEDFWRKRGYVKHAEMKGELAWHDIEEKAESPKTMLFWIKDLPQD